MWAGTVVAPDWPTSAANAFDDLKVEVGGGQPYGSGVGLNQHVRQDRNGVAALHDALNMVERLQERGALDDHTHSSPLLGHGALETRKKAAASDSLPNPGAHGRESVARNRAGGKV
jgi:hypothetical protein